MASKHNFIREGDVIDVAVEMLDIEADKSQPPEARAAAKFARLVGPSVGEAFDQIEEANDQLMVLAHAGKWSGMVTAGAVLPLIEDLPPKAREKVIDIVIETFTKAARLSLQDFNRSRNGNEIHRGDKPDR